jgi:hypothetical protein
MGHHSLQEEPNSALHSPRGHTLLCLCSGNPKHCATPSCQQGPTCFSAVARRALVCDRLALSLSALASAARRPSTSFRARASGSDSRLFSAAISYLQSAAARKDMYAPDCGHRHCAGLGCCQSRVKLAAACDGVVAIIIKPDLDG